MEDSEYESRNMQATMKTNILKKHIKVGFMCVQLGLPLAFFYLRSLSMLQISNQFILPSDKEEKYRDNSGIQNVNVKI